MNKLVVGAFVRHVRFPSYGTGRIKFIHPNGISLAVEFENETGTNHDCAGHGRHNYCRWTRAESLEVFNPIKVGDRVRIVSAPSVSNYYHPAFAGRLGTVLSFGILDQVADVKADGLGFCQYVPVADIELVPVDPVQAVKAATPKVKYRTFKKGSQADRILKFLIAGNSITPLKARQLFGAERLAARILEIRQAGHKIIATQKADLNGKVYGEYRLRKTNRFGEAA